MTWTPPASDTTLRASAPVGDRPMTPDHAPEPGPLEALVSPRGRMARLMYIRLNIAVWITSYAALFGLQALPQTLPVLIAALGVLGAALGSTTAMEIKRWHDLNRSGVWALARWVLVGLFVVTGPHPVDFPPEGAAWIVSIVLCAIAGTRGENAYGPPPIR